MTSTLNVSQLECAAEIVSVHRLNGSRNSHVAERLRKLNISFCLLMVVVVKVVFFLREQGLTIVFCAAVASKNATPKLNDSFIITCFCASEMAGWRRSSNLFWLKGGVLGIIIYL